MIESVPIKTLLCLRVCSSASTFLLSIVLLNRLNTIEIAQFSLIMSGIMMVGISLVSPIGQFIQVSYSRASPRRLHGALVKYCKYIAAISITLCFLLVLIPLDIDQDILIICGYVFISNLFTIVLNISNLRMRQDLFTPMSAILIVGNMLTALILFYGNTASISAYFSLLMVFQLLALIFFHTRFTYAYTPHFKDINIFELSFIRSSLLIALLLYLANHFLRLYIPYYYGMEVFSKYASVLIVLGQLWNTLETLLGQIFDPYTLKAIKAKNRLRRLMYVKILTIFICGIFIIPVVVGIDRYLLRPTENLPLMIVILFCVFFTVKAAFFATVQLYLLTKKTKTLVKLLLCVLLIFLPFGILGGYQGTIIGLSSALILGLMAALSIVVCHARVSL